MIDLSDDKKVEVLLKLIEENRKSAEWVKNFDFKVAYYPLLLYVALIVWSASNPLDVEQKVVLIVAVLLVMAISILFLNRNHTRHWTINEEFGRVRRALKLTTSDEYGEEPVADDIVVDKEFHKGRRLYKVIILGAAIFACFLIWVASGPPISGPDHYHCPPCYQRLEPPAMP